MRTYIRYSKLFSDDLESKFAIKFRRRSARIAPQQSRLLVAAKVDAGLHHGRAQADTTRFRRRRHASKLKGCDAGLIGEFNPE